MKLFISPSSVPPLPRRVQDYLAAIVRTTADGGCAIVSVILFGSAVRGGFAENMSDVDLMLILPDSASAGDCRRLRDRVTSLEIQHGLREIPARQRALETLFEQVAAADRSFFVCTRADLLSGNLARIMNLRPAQAFFVDRIVIRGILSSAVTVWGEELLADIRVLAIRRLDIFKAFFGLSSQVIVSALLFPLLPCATKYGMAALKHSLHSCYFCYHERLAALAEEVHFFQQRLGPGGTLERLMTLRRKYQPSFLFVVRCIPMLVRLHLRTALDKHATSTPSNVRT